MTSAPGTRASSAVPDRHLKIDKSFIDELHLDPQKASLVRGIVNLGKSLDLEVIAEGIEQPQQAERLRAMRSPLGQGFLFARRSRSIRCKPYSR
jgi:EAL domain-containing protein (putative c-di-GMP-specific phosphodiesterase class I)